MDILNISFVYIVEASFTASIVALFILLFKKLFKKNISIRFHHTLLIIVLLRFIMPIVPESPISLFNYLPNTDSQIKNTIPNLMSSMDDDNNRRQFQWNNIKVNEQKNHTKDKETSQNSLKIQPIKDLENRVGKHSFQNKIINVLSMVWCTGFLIIITGYSLIQFRFKEKLQSFKKLKDPKLLSVADKCKKIINIKDEVCVYIGDDFKSPCITGIFKPKIYLPRKITNTMGYEHFQHVILHELAHYKRKDLLYNLLGIVAASIHWFNPLIWVVIKGVKLDRELACDSYVLDLLGEEEAISYGMTIITVTRLFLTNQRQLGFASFFSTKTQLERRIHMIKKFKKSSYKITFLAVVGSIIIGGAALTNPVNAKEKIFNMKVSTDSMENQRFLINSSLKQYNNLDRLQSDANFEFKVPDFIPTNGYQLSSLVLKSKPERIRCSFSNISVKNREGFCFTLYGSKEDPSTYLNEVISREPLQLGSIKGESLETKTHLHEKYFVFQNDNIFYALSYKTSHKTKKLVGLGEISLDDVENIVNSLKKPKDIQNIDYTIEHTDARIYDINDVKNTRKTLGFNFKLPLKTPYGKIADSEVTKKYLNLIYSSGLFFHQSKEAPKYYTQFKENGSIEVTTMDQGAIDKVEGEWVKVNNKEIFKQKNICVLLANKKEPEMDVVYTWKEDNLYYSVTFYDGNKLIENADEIIQFFMDEKSVDHNLIQ